MKITDCIRQEMLGYRANQQSVAAVCEKDISYDNSALLTRYRFSVTWGWEMATHDHDSDDAKAHAREMLVERINHDLYSELRVPMMLLNEHLYCRDFDKAREQLGQILNLMRGT